MKFYSDGWIQKQSYVSPSVTQKSVFVSYKLNIFSDGLGWTAKQQKLIEDLGDDFELNKSQFKLKFTFEEDHTFEMFTQDVQNRSRLGHKSFTFFLPTQEGNPENAWQQFKCPMKFPQCSYNWCNNGENRSVTKS